MILLIGLEGRLRGGGGDYKVLVPHTSPTSATISLVTHLSETQSPYFDEPL